MQTIALPYDAEIEISDALDPDGELRFSVDDDADQALVWLDRDAAQTVVDTLIDAFDLGDNAELPAGAIRASDISLNEALLRVAAVHEQHVTFRYAKSDTSPIEVRTFIPQSVKSVGDHVTFVGQDEDREATRSFRSDRIKGVVQVVA